MIYDPARRAQELRQRILESMTAEEIEAYDRQTKPVAEGARCRIPTNKSRKSDREGKGVTTHPRTARALRVFGASWLVLAASVWILSAGFHIAKSQSLWSGLQDVMWWLAPWNLAGLVVNLASLSPALGAYVLADRLDKN